MIWVFRINYIGKEEYYFKNFIIRITLHINFCGAFNITTLKFYFYIFKGILYLKLT